MVLPRFALTLALVVSCAACTTMPVPTDTRPLQAPLVVQPLVEYEIALLNPSEACDQAYLNDALIAAGLDAPSLEFNWLPVGGAVGMRAYSDVTGEADEVNHRIRMRECVATRDTSRSIDVEGIIVLTILVDGGGDVLQAGVRQSTIGEPALLSCVMENVMGWEFTPGSSEQRFDVPLAIVPVR